MPGSASPRPDEIAYDLQNRFRLFDTTRLVGVSPETFKSHILSHIGTIDFKGEGYRDDELDQQRDLSVKFHWGHDHNFGTFEVGGRMGSRHIDLLANFVSIFPVSLADFDQKRILDVGCWTGGTTLLLSTLGGTVDAIEEVKKYAEMVQFLARSFGLEQQVSVTDKSLYDLATDERSYDRYDIAYFPGVIYHLSDPVLALRVLFNSLKVGGFILVESAGINTPEPFCRFDGSYLYHSGTAAQLSRGGWNWFLPSPSALARMMKEAGFDEIETRWHEQAGRVYGYGRKREAKGICRAGLSVPTIR
jgi:SAM-dependent methyltransferase